MQTINLGAEPDDGTGDSARQAGQKINDNFGEVMTTLAQKAPLASPSFTGTVSGITRAMVGLGNVDNTSDAAKPVSTAQQTALNLKAPLASPSFTGTVSGITKAMVGLGNVDNTSDAAKPVSTAQQTALNLKANLASPALTGTPSAPTAAQGTNTTQLATTAFVRAEVTALVASAPGTLDTLDELAAALGDDPNFATTITALIGLKAPLASPSFTGTSSFGGTVQPTTNNTIDLGGAANRWANGYITNLRLGSGATIWSTGSGSPEGVVTAPVGSLFARTDGGAATTLYVKQSGSGNTGWVANSGTGAVNPTAHAVICGGTSSSAPLQSVASLGTAGQVLTSNGAGALPSFQSPTAAPTGSIVDSVYAEYLTYSGGITAQIPIDDTIPQIGEGSQILTVSITPKSVTNKIRIRVRGQASGDAAIWMTAALFRNAVANALTSTTVVTPAAGYPNAMALEHEFVPGVTSLETYTVRVGPNTGSMIVNGVGSGRVQGGAQKWTIVVEEIKT